jgi:hypothetical protein
MSWFTEKMKLLILLFFISILYFDPFIDIEHEDKIIIWYNWRGVRRFKIIFYD